MGGGGGGGGMETDMEREREGAVGQGQWGGGGDGNRHGVRKRGGCRAGTVRGGGGWKQTWREKERGL